jgi:ribonucleoside-diphosphate reductase alpha chain
MKAVQENGNWEFETVLYGNPVEAPKTKDIFRRIAQAAWECGDPGVQFRDTINDMHTCPADGDINSSNPCSEYLFLDNTSCNLGSLNLLKLRDTTDFFVAVRCAIIGMDALICVSDYPTPEIAEGSKNYRTLGLGFTNLGGALLDRGIAYDSDAGRAFAASRTSIMAAAAWRTSVELAKAVGPFPRYDANSEHVREALAKHGGHGYDEWKDLPELVKEYGIRNAQLTVLAPTGTISFMMDCATTGIEPEFGLIKHKQLVGGDWIKIANPLVERAILQHKYFPGQDTLAARIVAEERIPDDCPDDLVQVLLTAAPWGKETRSLSWRAHLSMMAACQPFLSGGISKTVNLPNDATVEDVEAVLKEAWHLGLKSVAIYRDGSKASQPLTTKKAVKAMKVEPDRLNHASRWELPDDLTCTRHKVTIGGTDLYIHTGQHPDTAQPVEVFLTAGRAGSTLQGLLSTVGILSSQLLRRGVPASEIARMLRGQDFAPQGFTSNQNIPTAKSIPDYLAQYLERHGGEREEESHGRLCSNCGGMMIQAGSCHTCTACGQTTGCG